MDENHALIEAELGLGSPLRERDQISDSMGLWILATSI